MNTLLINGTDYTSLTSGLDDVKVTFALNKGNRTTMYSASGIFRIYGGDLDQLMLDVSLNWPAVLEIDDKIELNFDINARNVRVCEDGCTYEVNIQEITSDRISYEKLARSIISDDDAIRDLVLAGASGKMNYCFEVDWLGYVLAYVYWTVAAVVNVIAAIIDIFTGEPTLKAIQWYVIGCYKYHYPLNINQTCKFWAEKCNLTWQSSILSGNSHKNLYFLEGLGFTGYSRRKPTPALANINRDYIVNLTVPQLLDQLSLVFNADYRIIDGTLVFERKDWFPDNAEELKGYIDGSYCVVADPDQLVTNINYQWAFDPMDAMSVKVGKVYSARIDLNPDEWKSLRGNRDVLPRISVGSYNYDQFGDDDLRKFRWDIQNHGGVIQFEHNPVIGAGQTSEVRIFHLNKDSGGHLNPIPKQIPTGSSSYPIYAYDETLAFTYNGKIAVFNGSNALYPNHFEIDDVRLYPRYYADRITFVPDNICDTIDAIKNNSLNVYINTPYGRAIPQEIEYDVNKSRLDLVTCIIWP